MPAEIDEINNVAARQVITTRVVNAPREVVYQAWSNPGHLINWWGPSGFTNTFHQFDYRPGGHWVYTMHGPGFVGHYENEGVFKTIVPNKTIIWDRISKPWFRTYVDFEDEGNQTKINWRMLFPTVDDYNKMIKFVPEKNEENMDRLEAYLLKIQAGEV